ncbi:MAG: ribonuclease P protein component [Nitrospirota bacterium]|nr:ribonuclease P protein component [Nitrospirota bacterium]
MPYAYRKSERLRKNSDFVATMKGKRLSQDGLSLFYRKNGADGFRVGISVGKKLGNAVARNRLRRQLRDCIGRVLGDLTAGFDLVFVARKELSGRDFSGVLRVVTRILQRSDVLGPRSKGNAL